MLATSHHHRRGSMPMPSVRPQRSALTAACILSTVSLSSAVAPLRPAAPLAAEVVRSARTPFAAIDTTIATRELAAAVNFAAVYDLTGEMFFPAGKIMLMQAPMPRSQSAFMSLVQKDQTNKNRESLDDSGAVNTTAPAVAVAAVSTGSNKTKNAQLPLAPPTDTRSWLSWFRFTISFALVIKALCISSSIIYQASPLPMVKQFSVCGTGDSDSAPLVSIAYGCSQWCFYGLFAYFVTRKSGFMVLVYANMFGAVLGTYYVYTFKMNCHSAQLLQKFRFYLQVLSTVVVAQLISILVLPPVRALFFSGLISSVWGVVSSLSLLTTLPTVWRTKSSSSLPGPLLWASMLTSCLWLVCGVMLRDSYIIVPNGFAVCVTTYAFSLKIHYPESPPEDAVKTPPSTPASSHFEPACGNACIVDEEVGKVPESKGWRLLRALGVSRIAGKACQETEEDDEVRNRIPSSQGHCSYGSTDGPPISGGTGEAPECS